MFYPGAPRSPMQFLQKSIQSGFLPFGYYLYIAVRKVAHKAGYTETLRVIFGEGAEPDPLHLPGYNGMKAGPLALFGRSLFHL